LIVTRARAPRQVLLRIGLFPHEAVAVLDARDPVRLAYVRRGNVNPPQRPKQADRRGWWEDDASEDEAALGEHQVPSLRRCGGCTPCVRSAGRR
jgi:hypothetical protein